MSSSGQSSKDASKCNVNEPVDGKDPRWKSDTPEGQAYLNTVGERAPWMNSEVIIAFNTRAQQYGAYGRATPGEQNANADQDRKSNKIGSRDFQYRYHTPSPSPEDGGDRDKGKGRVVTPIWNTGKPVIDEHLTEMGGRTPDHSYEHITNRSFTVRTLAGYDDATGSNLQASVDRQAHGIKSQDHTPDPINPTTHQNRVASDKRSQQGVKSKDYAPDMEQLRKTQLREGKDARTEDHESVSPKKEGGKRRKPVLTEGGWRPQ